MPPGLFLALERPDTLAELVLSHLGQAIVVDNGPGPGRLATDDIAARRFSAAFPVQAVVEADPRVPAERVQDLPRAQRRFLWQARHEVQRHVRLSVLVQQLLEDLQRVGTVPAASHLERRGPQLVVLAGIVRDAASRVSQSARAYAGPWEGENVAET